MSENEAELITKQFEKWDQKRVLQYRIDQGGLHIGSETFSFERFRSFSIDRTGAFSCLVFMPLKRFSPLTTVYYDPSDEPKILALLSLYLPLEERSKDLIDELMWKIKF